MMLISVSANQYGDLSVATRESEGEPIHRCVLMFEDSIEAFCAARGMPQGIADALAAERSQLGQVETRPSGRPATPPTAADVRVECQRRIIALVGATSLDGCIIKQLNANMRANELNDIRHTRDLTAEEAAEAEALRDLAAAIKAIRAKSNLIEGTPPADYKADSYWTD